MRSIIAFALSFAVAGFANAQVQYQIKPETVPLNLRETWCQYQKRQCPLLCLQMPQTDGVTVGNTCDAKTLQYSCVCKGGISPNSTEYSQTLPFYVCQEWQNQCVAGCGQALACQASCRDDHPCGAQNPTRVTTTASTSMSATATATGGSAPTGGSNNYGELGAVKPSPAASGDKPSAASTLSGYSQACGLAIVITGLFTGFAALL